MKNNKITIGHGSGGKLTQELIENIFLPAFKNELLAPLSDQAVFQLNAERLAFTTDSYVVDPVFFPGGNIGDLAVNGTINDLAMSGAKPMYLSCGFIIETGFEIDALKIIVDSMKIAADKAEVKIVTGDTKVVECRGGKPQIFINTSGIGVINHSLQLGTQQICDGDVVIVSGRIGDHGLTILSQREGFSFELPIKSDTAALNHLVAKLVQNIPDIHLMRDVTRGGLATILNEIAQSANATIRLDLNTIPIHDAVRGACDMLGLDPLLVACEGRFMLALPEKYAQNALNILRQDELGLDACIIGRIETNAQPVVLGKNMLGVERIISMLTGEQLPRIC